MTMTAHSLVQDQTSDLARRLTASALDTEGRYLPTVGYADWLAERSDVSQFEVSQVPFGGMTGWHFSPDTGNLVHQTGRFFSIEGLEVSTDFRWTPRWTQPIINQPEIGIVGILVKEIDGVLHCLMQAKMEPGNVNVLQLSPTVQATRSNYTRVHRGAPTPYLDYFISGRGRILVDVLQSEQGAWFLHKRNRNMLVEATDDVEAADDFVWLTVGQLHELMRVENLVNMDSRTVLSCMPFAEPPAAARGPGTDPEFRAALAESVGGGRGALHSMAEVLSWFVALKSRYSLRQRSLPLRGLEGWRCTDEAIEHVDGKYFRIIGVNVKASNREVTSWAQPLVSPVGLGVSSFLTRRIDGVLHLLVQGQVEAGTRDVVEIAPTVHCLPGNYRDTAPSQRPPYLDYVLSAGPAQVRYEVVQSEEGGRFYHAENRYQILEVTEDFPMDSPDGYRWVTVAQLMALLRLSNYLNVEARSLVACLHTLW